jgi:hypothetical protein
VVDNVLGLFLLVVFSVCVVVLAAGVTWLVVKISPARSAQTQNRT